MTTRDEWILVRSEDELRPGMCVEERPCDQCNIAHRCIVLRIRQALTWQVYQSHSAVTLTVTPDVKCCPSGQVLFGRSIREGRLYRLSDSQATHDETRRELVRPR